MKKVFHTLGLTVVFNVASVANKPARPKEKTKNIGGTVGSANPQTFQVEAPPYPMYTAISKINVLIGTKFDSTRYGSC
jgi:hypothetical protein